MDRSYPLGVDILELKKAGDFYRRHGKALSGILHPNELRYVRSSKKPGESFALIFSAKEAVFKAIGASWMGTSGFREIQIFPKKDFSIRLKGRLKKIRMRPSSLKLSFIKDRRHVVATCFSGNLSPCAGT